MFSVRLHIAVMNERGMLAKIAAAISEAGSNIDHVSAEESDGSQYTVVNFTVQVHHRRHLAALIRSLRKIPEVVRINRMTGGLRALRIR